MSEEILQLKVSEVRKETSEAITIVFDQPASGKLDYKSGQFLTLIVEVNGKEERRAYSLCSSPYTDEHLAVTVKRVDKGLVSNYLNEKVKAGDQIKLLPPMGNFVLEPKADGQRHIVLFGGGSGITPLISILKTTLSQEAASMVTLIYVNRDEDSIIFKARLKELQGQYGDRLRIHHYLDEDNIQMKKGLLGLKKKSDGGFINKEKLSEIMDKLHMDSADKAEYYICGPQGMMEVVETTLKARKISKELIHKESFVSELNPAFRKDKKSAGGAEKIVTIKMHGDEHKIPVKDGNFILESAMVKGIDLPFSCQSGLCTACMGKCLSGEVNIDGQQALTEGQVEEGFVLTCIGRPMTDDVVIEID